MLRGATLGSLALCLSAAVSAEGLAGREDFLARVETLALMQTLNAELLASRSATLTLERWCRDHALSGAREAKVVARLIRGEAKPASAEQRQRLEVAGDEEIRYRQVELVCGDRVLSRADNWYVPGRLTAEMNRLLETTDTPFGKAVLDLKPYRQTIEARLHWSPLPAGWESRKAAELVLTGGSEVPPQALFEHRAVLYTQGRRPFSEVREVYQRELLDFALPRVE
jgi:chorismate-pyruvate lyase